MKENMKFTHTDNKGKARMVDIHDKDITTRRACAEAFVTMSAETMSAIKENSIKKGDVIAIAKIAGIQAVKRTHELIPLCHPLMVEDVEIEIETLPERKQIHITCSVMLTGKTGAEMEALTGASIFALTIYDMCKSIDKKIEIGPIRLLSKEGGKSGSWHR